MLRGNELNEALENELKDMVQEGSYFKYCTT